MDGKTIYEQALSCSTAEELCGLMQGQSAPSEDLLQEAQDVFEALQQYKQNIQHSGEVTDEELADVVGGFKNEYKLRIKKSKGYVLLPSDLGRECKNWVWNLEVNDISLPCHQCDHFKISSFIYYCTSRPDWS